MRLIKSASQHAPSCVAAVTSTAAYHNTLFTTIIQNICEGLNLPYYYNMSLLFTIIVSSTTRLLVPKCGETVGTVSVVVTGTVVSHEI
jgi:hypothetical protein